MKKSSKTKIARVYSAALYEAAVEKKCVAQVWEDAAKLQNLLKTDAEFEAYLASPLWDEKDKNDVLAKTAKILGLRQETLNCLEIVTANHRVGDLAMILDDFGKIYYLKNNIAEVDVDTVKKLSAAQDNNLKKVLAQIFAKEVVINYNINPSIIGGLRIQYGSKMFDDSLAAKLNYLENVMKGK